MKYSVITISREFGSGGRTIGKLLAEKLGYEFYDVELVQKIADESGVAKHIIEEYGEEFVTEKKKFFKMFDNNWGSKITDELYYAQRKVIAELSQKGNCVIVGRCADYILRDNKDTLHVFVHADMEFKKKRIVELYGEREETPESRILGKDKRRQAYYKYYTSRNWGQAKDYDICLDSGKFGIEKCVEVLENLVKE